MKLAGRICRNVDCCFNPKNPTILLRCFRSGYMHSERKIATNVAPRYVWKNACSGIGKSNRITARGSRSKMTLAIITVATSMKGKRRVPISRAGPKWYGVNGISNSQPNEQCMYHISDLRIESSYQTSPIMSAFWHGKKEVKPPNSTRWEQKYKENFRTGGSQIICYIIT